MEDDLSGWVLELEEALLDEAPPDQIKLLLAGRPLPPSLRTEVWTLCLETSSRKSRLESFDYVYDLPEQSEIRAAANAVFEQMPDMGDQDRLQMTSDLESILTVYLKSTGQSFQSKHLAVLRPVLQLNLHKNEKYSVFTVLMESLVPGGGCEDDNSAIYHLARLLLLYHDPSLCSHLDSMKVGMAEFTVSWFSCLFSQDTDKEVSDQMWDIYVVTQDPWLIFFMVTVLLVNCRDSIMDITQDKANLIQTLKSLPSQLEADDIPDLVTLAQVYSTRTPTSFRTVYHSTVFGQQDPSLDNILKCSLCLPVAAEEILASSLASCQFFVVDCRAADQYNAGHLSRAFHLDCALMLQDPAQFTTACSALIAFQQSALAATAGGEHLVFLGLGDPSGEVDGNMMMAVSRFLKQHTKYISVLTEGYPGLQKSDPTQQQHQRGDPEETMPDHNRIHEFKSNFKSKSASIKSSLFNYIYNPSPRPPSQEHVSQPRKGSKLYKNTGDVFCMEEEEEEDNVLDIEEVKKDKNTIHLAECQRVGETGLLSPCHLQVTSTHLNVLVPGPRSGTVSPVASHHLSSIVKITSKKRQPEVITFKFGTSQKDEVTVFDMDRFFIPTAGKVTSVVKQQIEKLK